jgi:hypothetical protein
MTAKGICKLHEATSSNAVACVLVFGDLLKTYTDSLADSLLRKAGA